VLAGLASYANSFSGPFIYDDLVSILDNPSIRHLWPLGPVLSPPCDTRTVTGRPILNFSLAVSYRLAGKSVWGYHATNVAIHLINGLLLLGILRRSFDLPSLRSRYGHAVPGLTFAIALLWTVHPLQTESVTYISQRAESLAGMFYLLTLYCVIRGSQSTFRARWYSLAVGACLLGMGVKEVVVTAPLVILLYDRTFLEDSFRTILRKRWALYLGLFATWGFLLCLLSRTGPSILQKELGPIGIWPYARSQTGVILHYLRLSFWPHPLCLNYDWPVANTLGAIVPPALLVGLLLASTVWGLAKWRAWAFLGTSFFLILAPTSSVMPLPHLAFEHRMYLPLAAVLTLVIAGIYLAGRQLTSRGLISQRFCLLGGIGLMLTAAVVLGLLTFLRNGVYRTALSLWQDTVQQAPHNPYAHSDLGMALADAGRTAEAIEHYQEAIRLKPDYAPSYNNLGNALLNLGRTPEAIQQLEHALRLTPDYPSAHSNLGIALYSLARLPEALAHFEEASRLDPNNASIHSDLGNALHALGRIPEAIEHLELALRLKPDSATAHNNYGSVLASLGRFQEAIQHYQHALRIRPQYADAYYNQANTLLRMQRFSDAVENYEKALQITPDFPEAYNNLGITLTNLNRIPEAMEKYRQAIRVKPDYPEPYNNLGNALVLLGRIAEAREQFERAVQLDPRYADAQLRLMLALAETGQLPEAIQHGRQLVRLVPDESQAQRLVAWLMATHGPIDGLDPQEAVQLATRACDLTARRDSECLDTLAAAYAAASQFDKAIATAKEAWQLAQAAGQNAQAQNIHMRLQLYRDHKPYREPRKLN
jgi:tetratricopeptide (TPR) repeat protein